MIAVDWGSLAAPNPPQSRRVREFADATGGSVDEQLAAQPQA
jgi:hypothetical protein